MSLNVSTGCNYIVSTFDEKKALFQKLTGRSIEIPENGVMPHILSQESTIQLGFFGEFFRVGFSSPDGHMSAVENLSRRFAELREELLEQYKDYEDMRYKRLGELNQAFENALRSTTLVPLPQMPNVPLVSSNESASVRSSAERAWREHEAMSKITRYIQDSLIRHMDTFFEAFILSIQSNDFQTAFDSSMAELLDGESRSLESLSYRDAVRMRDALSQWHEVTDEHGNQVGVLNRHDASFRAILRDENISLTVRREIAGLLGFSLFTAGAGMSGIDPSSNSIAIFDDVGETEVSFNIKGGMLILIFCSKGSLVSAEIVGGGQYGKSNAELGRVVEEDELASLLKEIGIDASPEFSVNGRIFRISR